MVNKLNISNINFIKKQKDRSKRCLEEYTKYNKKCLHCSSDIPFEKRMNKFCNSSCAASYNNKGKLRNKIYYDNLRKDNKNKIHLCICVTCNKKFESKNKKTKCCSKECKHIQMKNIIKDRLEREDRFKKYNVPITQVDEHHSLTKECSIWKIEKIIKKGDYLYCVIKNHPKKTSKDYVLLHRIIMENHIGRLLKSNEVVHHINGNKFDNRIENLQLMTHTEHTKFHLLERPKVFVLIKCPNCQKIFERKLRRAKPSLKLKKLMYCSKQCAAIFQYKLIHKETEEIKKSISENVIKIFRKFPDNTEQTLDS